MATVLNEKPREVVVEFRDKSKVEYPRAVIDYANRVIRIQSDGKSAIIPLEAVFIVAWKEEQKKEQEQ